MLAMVRPCSCPSNRSEPKAGCAAPPPWDVGAAESCSRSWLADGARGESALRRRPRVVALPERAEERREDAREEQQRLVGGGGSL